ncbi:MAG: sigma 54-interacting transcriptional regulator [Betaproteobacteria bacterium]|jgi:two-component system response regulator GlrR|nr:MAG: sigma 54-interacting transcriptional regulator [Betaproteobacteria bacterium]
MSNESRILIVDDDIDLIRLLTFRLQGAGYRVESADSAERALAKLSVSVPHLVITDLRMGGMDGMALFQNIRKTHPALPVIILTAHGNIPDAVAATQRGVFGYLTKPFDSKELLSQVEKAVSVSGIVRDGEDTDQSWREEIITRSPMIESILAKAKLVAASDASVLITGDSGTGKEMLARAIHSASPRAKNPFIAVNCSAIPEQLLESELFGHMKGSFTGAARDYKGLVQAADTGTIFLDEIGDMAMPLQVKLLRVLQEKEIRPVGSTRSIPVNIRVVSATHRDLEEAIHTATFREDLYYRLNVVSFHLPPLAERREDIPVLATYFLNQISAKYGKSLNGFSAEAIEMLVKYPWPGNVRELYNVIEQSVALSTTPIITPTLVESAQRGRTAELASFESARSEFEREYLAKLLKITGGNVTQAAKLAKRNRTEFYKLLQRHHLNPKMFKTP